MTPTPRRTRGHRERQGPELVGEPGQADEDRRAARYWRPLVGRCEPARDGRARRVFRRHAQAPGRRRLPDRRGGGQEQVVDDGFE